jgi:radical SAM protein with 4Fe4S-binding SPASM domain
MLQLAQANKVKLRVQRLRPSGRGIDSWDLLHPTPEQFVRFHSWLLAHKDVLTADSFFFLNALGAPVRGFSICGAAKMICLVSPTGDVYPCPFIQPGEFASGNVRERPFREIWANAEVFKTFRSLELHECSGCPANSTCNGGCRATAYFIRKSLESSDAECMRRAMAENPNLKLMLQNPLLNA